MMDGESNRGSAAEEREDWIYIDWIQAEVVTTSWHLDQYRLLTVRYTGEAARHFSIESCIEYHRFLLLYWRGGPLKTLESRQTCGYMYVRILSEQLKITMCRNNFSLSASPDHAILA